MENCNHRYKKDTCIKCGHERTNNNKISKYKQEQISREAIQDDLQEKITLNISKGIINNPKYIKDWKELKDQTSPTHTLKIDIQYGCGWIEPKDADENSWEGRHYLSTHTFYGGTNEYSTKVLQSCGFNVVLANWDEIGY